MMDRKYRIRWLERHLASLYQSRAMINQAIHELEEEKRELEKPMKINWNIKETPTPKGSAMRRTAKWIKKFIFGTSVPLHNSNHYNRDHFI